ncbi:unnamed protein product [Schistosoma turkestanicum]|nr:unnamed protein product [Schistosoma turkestanicum]
MNSKSDMRVPKPPKPPEKPLMPYMRYSRKVWEQVKNSNPHLKLWEVGKIIGQMWRDLPDDEKILYVEEYDAEKIQYTESLRQYHSSPAYQAWLVAKERAEKSMEEQDQERRQSVLRSRDRGNELPQGDLRESYILEDNEEDTEDQFTAKHVAAARFQRNHRLMQEVLSDTRLPDPGQLITQSRLNTLRLQVEQLKNHKRNLCQEIEGCKARHQAKVQRIREESERFRLDYQKLTTARPVITESQFADMIIKAKYDMQREEEERKTRYLAELEIRRKRQQQRQQREAELLESERRRQLLHQQQLQVHMRPNQVASSHNDPNIQFGDRSLERLITQDKRDDTNSQPSQKLPASTGLLCPTNHPKGAPEVGHEINPNLYPGLGNTFTQPVTQNSLQRFPQSGHTQHHYPPPLHYLPNAAAPSNPPGLIHQRSPVPSIQQAAQNNSGKPNAVSLGRTKKVPSSASSTSSASSASSTSSKKKKVDSDPIKDATNQDMRERPVSREEVMDQAKPGDFGLTPGQSTEFQQGSTAQSRQLITSQYQPAPVPANSVVPAQIPGGPVQTPYCYEVGMGNQSNPPLSTGTYYHQPVSVSNPGGYSHPRPQFSQHTPYNAVQYHSVAPQPSSEHPPPPPVYIQHMPQQSHVSQPVPTMVGPNQHSSSHIPPQQHNSNNWHHSGPPPYPPHYGPSRYPVSGGSVGYPMQPPRNFAPNSGVYSMPHYLVGQHGPQTHPHQNISSIPVSIQDGPAASQSIPAPPPYQQQQQPSSVVSYWPAQQQVPPDYVQSQHPSHYMPGSQTEPVVPSQQTLPSVDNVHPCSTMSVSSADIGMGQVVSHQSQGANIYYQGGPVPPYTHGSNVGPSGFYSVPPQHYTPHQHSGHSWSGYCNSGPPQVPSYPQSQQHVHHQSPQCSSGAYPNPQISTKLDQTATTVPVDNSTSVGAAGGPNSQPPSTNEK